MRKVFRTNNGLGGRTRGRQQAWARKAANLFRERRSAEEWPQILGAVTEAPGVYPTPPLKPDLQGASPRNRSSPLLGCAWSFPPKPLASQHFRANRDVRYRRPREPAKEQVRGSGSTTRFERVRWIRHCPTGILWAPSEPFPPNFSVKLAIACRPSMWGPPWPHNYLDCGTVSRAGELGATMNSRRAGCRESYEEGLTECQSRTRAFRVGASRAPCGHGWGYTQRGGGYCALPAQ